MLQYLFRKEDCSNVSDHGGQRVVIEESFQYIFAESKFAVNGSKGDKLKDTRGSLQERAVPVRLKLFQFGKGLRISFKGGCYASLRRHNRIVHQRAAFHNTKRHSRLTRA
jgi:hypothetical protein